MWVEISMEKNHRVHHFRWSRVVCACSMCYAIQYTEKKEKLNWIETLLMNSDLINILNTSVFSGWFLGGSSATVYIYISITIMKLIKIYMSWYLFLVPFTHFQHGQATKKHKNYKQLRSSGLQRQITAAVWWSGGEWRGWNGKTAGAAPQGSPVWDVVPWQRGKEP